MVPQILTVAEVWPISNGHYGVEKFSLRSVILIDRPSGLDCALRSPSARAGTRLTQDLLYTFADYSCFVGKCLPTFRLPRKREGHELTFHKGREMPVCSQGFVAQ